MTDSADSSVELFGDAVGLAVFLGGLCVAGITWQVGFFITDSLAVANGLRNVVDGHLAIEEMYYSLTLQSQPGLHVADNQLYARNYGQVFLALPLYYVFEALTALVDFGLLLAGLWCIAVLACCRQVGVVLDRRPAMQVAGSVLAITVLGTSVSQAVPIDDGLAAVVALQALSVLAIAVTGLAVYRAVSRFQSQRVAVVAASSLFVATPLWFWAAVPKRHTLTAAAVATLLFWFGASRQSGPRVTVPFRSTTVSKTLLLRAAAYALIGLVAWVHVFEGALLLGVFAVADFTTTSSTSRRALVVIVVALAIGFTPFVLTNLAIAGNPAEPPRLTTSFSPQTEGFSLGPGGKVVYEETSGTGGVDPDSEGGESTASDNRDNDPGVGVLGRAARAGETVVPYVNKAVEALDAGPARLYHTYIRSGAMNGIPSYDMLKGESVDLTYLESAPLFGGLLGGLLGGLAVAFGRVRRRFRNDGAGTPCLFRPRRALRLLRTASPARETDAFAAALVVGFGILYFPYLPLFSQLTVRYLLPTVPVATYLLVRLPVVTEAIDHESGTLLGSYAGFVVFGSIAIALGVPRLDLAIGEIMQLHALVNLVVCSGVVASVVTPAVGINLDRRVSAGLFGFAAAATTVLVVFMQLAYFEYGKYAVPATRIVADALTVLP